MAIWQYDISLVPIREMDRDNLANELSSILPRAESWSQSIMIWGDLDGNCVKVCDDGSPPELLIRIDLRGQSGSFVRRLVSFATKMGFRIENADGKEMPPMTKDIAEDIEKSDAFRFVSNPVQFLESLR